MTTSKTKEAKTITSADIQDRGRSLQHRFRVAGIPHYTRWLVDKDPKLEGDGPIQYRIQRLFNGRGSVDDLELLKKCEAIADRFLGRQAA